ncbi:OLC1v1011155C1 [Oldenlandia corymbosa var. corymbosa]|uniref:OLC1v1011155C1 n=1 Tax=Oldenlandia corymbosa var. corymbosa TaxID=529605 RepID=A0AAV1DVD6_OLDCO|nr:OLC1v1011155C1 [Oldenlandia corymbosa var. corymbosa]
MAAFNPKFYHQYRLRSVSLPTTLHPSTVKIEQIVNKLKTFETSSSFSSSFSRADHLSNSLVGLKELYQAIEELLALQITKQALSQHQDNPRVKALVEESVTFIDVCNNSRDTVMQMIQGVRGLRSSFRRNKLGELSIESDISEFNFSRKGLRKEISRSLAKLKSTDNNRGIHLHLFNRSEDHQILTAVKALTEASLLTISTLSSLLLFLSVPVMKSKQSKWSLVSKLMQKGAFAGDQGQRNKLNELENVDIALGDLLIHSSCKENDAGKDKIESAQRKLEALETVLENLENILESLFRHLIRARVSLLNIFSH